MTADGLAHHGVLAHKHDGQSTQAGTDVLHLLGAHVVGAHDEALWELIEQFLEEGSVNSISQAPASERIL